MQTQTLNRVQSLTRSDDCECDDCGAVATLRLPQQTKVGVAYRDFCKNCYSEYTYEKSQRSAG